ncbi:hypothetical protein HY837_00280 [archaeon]|nr:hypothetical protein [archaeon]
MHKRHNPEITSEDRRKWEMNPGEDTSSNETPVKNTPKIDFPASSPSGQRSTSYEPFKSYQQTYYSNYNAPKHNFLKTACTVVSALGFVFSFGYGISSCGRLNEAERVLMQNADYVESKRLEGITSNLDSAVYELTYRGSYTTFVHAGKSTVPVHHPARYPDPLNAKELIQSAAQQLGDLETIDDKLIEVAGKLPNENNVRTYNGSAVNNQTFENERNLIGAEQNNISRVVDSHMDKVPQDLKDKKSEAKNNIWFSVALGILSLLGFGLSIKKYD